jgi:hypothetical protein
MLTTCYILVTLCGGITKRCQFFAKNNYNNEGKDILGVRVSTKTGKPVPEIIDPLVAKTSPKRSFSMTEYERFGLVFTKTRVYKFGHRSHGSICQSVNSKNVTLF